MTHTIPHDDHHGPHDWEPGCAFVYLDLVQEDTSRGREDFLPMRPMS